MQIRPQKRHHRLRCQIRQSPIPHIIEQNRSDRIRARNAHVGFLLVAAVIACFFWGGEDVVEACEGGGQFVVGEGRGEVPDEVVDAEGAVEGGSVGGRFMSWVGWGGKGREGKGYGVPFYYTVDEPLADNLRAFRLAGVGEELLVWKAGFPL